MPGLTVLDGCRTLQLTQGKNCLIDEEDWSRLSRFYWQVRLQPHTSYAFRGQKTGSRRTTVKSTTISMHRELIGAPANAKVDHRNGDGLDNRKSNLRLATTGQNQRNRRKHKGKSRYKGVWWASNAWCASISVDKTVIRLGRFTKEEEAALAYDAAAREHFGEFALTNADMYGDYWSR